MYIERKMKERENLKKEYDKFVNEIALWELKGNKEINTNLLNIVTNIQKQILSIDIVIAMEKQNALIKENKNTKKL